jgi:hypothetical protein
MYTLRAATGAYTYDAYFVIVGMLGAFFIVQLVTCVQFYYYDKHKADLIVYHEK